MFSLCMAIILAHSEDECNKKDAGNDTLKNNLVGGEVVIVHARHCIGGGGWDQAFIFFSFRLLYFLGLI